jgi:glyoxylase-like metal-dependent hydrolase (beta-lactamase superfamily II)
MGFARRAQRELGVPLWTHSNDRRLVAHPGRYDHERSRLGYLRHPEFLKIFSEMTVMGALWVKGSDSARNYGSHDQLDVPGRPQVIFTPGHTGGHCSLLLPTAAPFSLAMPS